MTKMSDTDTDKQTDDQQGSVEMFLPTTLEEAHRLLPLARLGHKESYFAELPFDEATFIKICTFVKEKPSEYGAVYADYKGEPAAFALYLLRPFFNSPRLRVTLMHGIYVRSDLRGTPAGGYMWNRMIQIARAWGIPRSSYGIMFNVTTGIAMEASDSLLRANGCTYLGGNYFLRS